MSTRRVLRSLKPGGVLTLHPGDIAVATAGQTLDTLLGSCVAVLLTDRRHTLAAMNHVVHAQDGPRGDTRYVAASMEALCAGLRASGFEPRLCEARLYGGGNMFPDRYAVAPVGDSNLHAVRDWMHRLGLSIVEEDAAGPYYRRVTWTVGDGPPRVRRTPVGDESDGCDAF